MLAAVGIQLGNNAVAFHPAEQNCAKLSFARLVWRGNGVEENKYLFYTVLCCINGGGRALDSVNYQFIQMGFHSQTLS